MILSLNGIIAGRGVAPSTLLNSLLSVYKAESNANDSLSTYNGTPIGGLTYTTGKSGDSFTFNGTNAYVGLPNNAFNFNTDFSVSLWANLTTLSGIQPLFSNFKDSTNYYGYVIFVFNSNLYFRICDGLTTNVYDITTAFTSTNSWKHIVITRKRSVITKIYIDGVLITSANTVNQGYDSTMQYQMIGGYYDTNGYKYLGNNSKIDEVGLWTKELTSTEVTELYRCGSGSFYPYTSFSALDSDACAFIGAASITDTTQKNAINQLVLDLKSANIWAKMKAIYPFVGGTASQHRFNLKDPRTVSGAYYLNFYGGGTHSANGYQPDGATAYADTQFIPSGVLSQNSTHISSYIRNTSTGVLIGTDNAYRLWIAPNFNGSTKYVEINTTTTTPLAISTAVGLWVGNRTANNITKLFNNNTVNATTSQVSTGLDSHSIFLASRNDTGIAINYSSAEQAFASIGDGLTDTEATAFYNAVQAYQTTLGRQV